MHEALSCRVNALLGGSPDEMLCARIHREGWRTAEILIDAAFRALRGDDLHCAWMAHHRGDDA